MKSLRPYLLVILIVLPVIVLVLVRAMAPGSFKPDARKRAEASFTGANLLNSDQVAALGSKPLIVKLADGSVAPESGSSDTLYMEAGRILEKKNLETLRNYGGTVLLVSENPALAAKAWMILSQMGYHDLYIFTEDAGTEVLKYKFRPDSAAGI